MKQVTSQMEKMGSEMQMKPETLPQGKPETIQPAPKTQRLEPIDLSLNFKEPTTKKSKISDDWLSPNISFGNNKKKRMRIL